MAKIIKNRRVSQQGGQVLICKYNDSGTKIQKTRDNSRANRYLDISALMCLWISV